MADIFMVLDAIEEAGTLEDHREHTKEDLKKTYSLTDQEATDLHYLIQRQFDPSTAGITLEQVPSWIYKEFFFEAIHSGCEGFTQEQQVTFLMIQDDLCRYWNEVKDDKNRDPVTGRESDCTYNDMC